eukprot:scaffold722_cov255-Prasinococcus_capsulatus_cf.AAC.5
MPLAVEIPAPVKTTRCLQPLTSAVSACSLPSKSVDDSDSSGAPSVPPTSSWIRATAPPLSRLHAWLIAGKDECRYPPPPYPEGQQFSVAE